MTNGYTIEQTAVPLDKGDRRAAPRGSADAELVGRVLAGELSAFDCLVLRHRETVLRTARGSVGDWDRAEDVAQQAFIEALSGLRGLREPAKLRSWLITITKRCAARTFRTPEPALVEFTDTVLYPLPALPPDPALDDLRERVRASLHDLSARSRTVVVLHYLDGYSCREIGAQLGIPDGTVKRILHESRESLRRSMGVTRPHTKGVPTEMETKKIGPRDLVWWINGNRGPGDMMRSALAHSICLATNKKAKTIDQIARDVDANPAYVREAIEPLIGEVVMEKVGDRYRAAFIPLDADDWIRITAEVRDQGSILADKVLPHLPAIEEAWNRTAMPDRGFPWEAGIWPTLAIFLLNIGIGRQSHAGAPTPSRASGRQYHLGGREAVGDEHVVWGTGFDCYCADDGLLNCGLFWSYGFDRYRAGWTLEKRKVLTRIARGVSDVEVIAQEACLPPDTTREVIASLVEAGVVERHEDRLSLAFPVFREAESDILAPVVDGIAETLYREVVEERTADLYDRLRRLGYGHYEGQFPEWRRWLEGNIAGEALRELLRRGVLPDPGQPAPARFCLIGWYGDLPLMSWHKK